MVGVPLQGKTLQCVLGRHFGLTKTVFVFFSVWVFLSFADKLKTYLF